ncbi:Aspartate 1-decarboxylase alpha chain [Listeria monocytogenes N53-1]|nr:Aspartate 1-decarboxylase alpha chain [Listeria monocytogenes N53-1]
MEMFLPYSIQNPYIETTKNSAELMFVTDTENHQFTLANLEPGNNLVTITATMASESKTITINLPDLNRFMINLKTNK